LQSEDGICKRFSIEGSGDTADPSNLCAGAPAGFGAVLGVSVGGGGGGGGAGGSANFGPCPGGGACLGGSGETSGAYDYEFVYYNRSDPPPAGLSVVGCEWNYGDGSPVVSFSASQCDIGDFNKHTFPPINEALYPYPAACPSEATTAPPKAKYNVTLKQLFSNGTSATLTKTTFVPNCP
jgi:hypothetical protein